MDIFDNDELRYVELVRDRSNRNRLVANITRRRIGEREPSVITMHIAGCGTINSENRTNYTTHEYYKVVFDENENEDDVANWTMSRYITD